MAHLNTFSGEQTERYATGLMAAVKRQWKQQFLIRISFCAKIPLIKVWCAAHRTEFAWKSVSREVVEVSKVLSILSNISTYFHFFNDNITRLMVMPKIFEITFALLRSVLVSWNALVIYFQRDQSDFDCAGYLNYFNKLENLELIAFLADLLFTFSRLQKQLQSDKLT